ncbi:hypothetical protein [Streptomyces sp. NBC_01443]|uniref:hypothetical protein n=1 Tax=Streptomyces sp. NBC_01443 TaxID=2903868 RepID=UPI002253CDA2|nr:hypothetical protein [Streptomyces sp. NBC_01443]MCX4629633.1 hypothetical protein [Streptomyces sp. NBC_01443]
MACRKYSFVIGVVSAGLLLSACSGESEQAAAVLPDRVCWGTGAFSGKELAPLAGSGQKVRDDSPATFDLPQDNKKTSCTLYVDGDIRFHAGAWRLGPGQDFFWDTQQKQHPDKLDLGNKGLVWDDGAVVALTCKRADATFELELSLDNGSLPGVPKDPRPYFTGLMEQYHEFATKQLRCGS